MRYDISLKIDDAIRFKELFKVGTLPPLPITSHGSHNMRVVFRDISLDGEDLTAMALCFNMSNVLLLPREMQ